MNDVMMGSAKNDGDVVISTTIAIDPKMEGLPSSSSSLSPLLNYCHRMIDSSELERWMVFLYLIHTVLIPIVVGGGVWILQLYSIESGISAAAAQRIYNINFCILSPILFTYILLRIACGAGMTENDSNHGQSNKRKIGFGCYATETYRFIDDDEYRLMEDDYLTNSDDVEMNNIVDSNDSNDDDYTIIVSLSFSVKWLIGSNNPNVSSKDFTSCPMIRFFGILYLVASLLFIITGVWSTGRIILFLVEIVTLVLCTIGIFYLDSPCKQQQQHLIDSNQSNNRCNDHTKTSCPIGKSENQHRLTSIMIMATMIYCCISWIGAIMMGGTSSSLDHTVFWLLFSIHIYVIGAFLPVVTLL